MADPTPESSFEDFCTALGLPWQLVPPSTVAGEKRPDYLITGHDNSPFYVELKAVTPNEDEQAQLDILYSGKGASSFSVLPGAKVRGLISKANAQLKALASDAAPGVLAIICLEPALNHHVDPYAILTAMRGLDVVPVTVPKEPSQSPVFHSVQSGPKKQMTEDANTSISAILVPYFAQGFGWAGELYHNRFAGHPLNPRTISASTIRHWQISPDERDWQPHSAAV